MRAEHGYVGTRYLVGLGLVSLLVWIVPIMFLSKKQAELVTAVAPVGATSAAQAGAAPADPVGKARDVQAQSLMNSAIQVAQVWYASNGSFAGFGPEQASQDEPSITFTTGPAASGAVSMRVTPDSVVMVTLSGTGGPLCAAATGNVVSYGRVDAPAAAQCTGGW